MQTLREFLQTSYTAAHAVENGAELLRQADFVEVTENTFQKLQAGQGCFVATGGSLFAFKTSGALPAFSLAVTHTDSPALKLKGKRTIRDGYYTRLNVERYGGCLPYTFFDRPLRLAGRLFTADKTGIKTKTYVSSCTVVIPSLAIHLRDPGEGFSPEIQKHLLPVLGAADAPWEKEIDDSAEFDLYAVPDSPAFTWGVDDEFLCAPRIDNLTGVYASLCALIESNPTGTAVCACFDGEEVGSTTRQSAGSSLFAHVLQKYALAQGLTEEQYADALAGSFALSSDNAHAYHPAYPDKADPVNRIVLNGGIVIKHHANYATDGFTAAFVKNALTRADIPYQDYYHPADLRCGSTVGLTVAAGLGIPVCDIGLAQWAMHGAAESLCVADVTRLSKGLCTFFQTPLPR